MRRRDQRKHLRPSMLRMTSLMDILTVLLLFLLKSFVVEGEVVTPASGLTLPESSSEISPQESVVLAIVGDTVSIGDHVVARVDENDPDMYIESLGAALDEARERQHALALRRGDEDPEAQVTIQGDREMAFEILQRVMYTCNQTGFDAISLAVLRTS